MWPRRLRIENLVAGEPEIPLVKHLCILQTEVLSKGYFVGQSQCVKNQSYISPSFGRLNKYMLQAIRMPSNRYQGSELWVYIQQEIRCSVKEPHHLRAASTVQGNQISTSFSHCITNTIGLMGVICFYFISKRKRSTERYWMSVTLSYISSNKGSSARPFITSLVARMKLEVITQMGTTRDSWIGQNNIQDGRDLWRPRNWL